VILQFYDSSLQSEFILYITCRVKKTFLTTWLDHVMYTVRSAQPRANGRCSIEMLLYATSDTTIACCCCFVVTDGGQ